MKDKIDKALNHTQMLHGTGIFTYIFHKFMVNVGKYSSPMEHMGHLQEGTIEMYHTKHKSDSLEKG